MMKVKNKVNFNKIWKLIQEIDAGAGMFIFRDTNKKMTKKEKLLALTWPIHAFLAVLFIVSTLVVSKFKLINVILCASFFMGYLMFYTILIKLIRNKDMVKDIFKWCESLYDIETKWHKLVQNVAEPNLVSLEQRTVKILKWFRRLCYFDGFGMSAGFAFVGLFLPESIYPKFSAPLPLYLPFKQQETWVAFVTTTAAQTALCVLSAGLLTMAFGYFFCIALHVLGYLDIIEEAITENFKQKLLTKHLKVEEVEKAPQPSTSKLQLSVLAAINQTTATKCVNKDDVSFDDWMAILTEMISDVNSIINSFKKLYGESFLLFEMTTLGFLFASGLVFIVIRQQYFFAIGMLISPVFLYVFCFINEKILEKFDDIKEALYDIPWYDLTPKQQRTLLIVLNCDEIQKGFTAAGIHDLTIERFAIIMKAGYTNLLVLKDLVMK